MVSMMWPGAKHALLATCVKECLAVPVCFAPSPRGELETRFATNWLRRASSGGKRVGGRFFVGSAWSRRRSDSLTEGSDSHTRNVSVIR
jgi:hypothetical protein